MTGARTTITIDRLVLRGVDRHHAQALAASLKAELERALAAPGAQAALARGGAIPALRVGKLTMQPGRAGARALGAQMARGIARGVARSGGTR